MGKRYNASDTQVPGTEANDDQHFEYQGRWYRKPKCAHCGKQYTPTKPPEPGDPTYCKKCSHDLSSAGFAERAKLRRNGGSKEAPPTSAARRRREGKDVVAPVEKLTSKARAWKPETGSSETSSCQPATLENVLDRFRSYLSLPDSGPVEVVLGAIVANLLPGDPIWLILVGPSGWGKTEILNSVTKTPHIHRVSVLTEASLLSGTPKRECEGAKGGLLREMGAFGILWVKDFGGVLSLNRDSRGPILAALREVYDGSWTRHVGSDGGRSLTWTGKAGLVGGATPSIDQHYAVMATLGERFVYYRMNESDEEERARRALGHAGHEEQMRAELAKSVAGLFASLEIPSELTPLSDPETERLIATATFATRCRSAVERDAFQGREIQLVPGAESPTRVVKVLRQLLEGLTVIGVSRDRAWELVTKVALDSMPALRHKVLLSLLQDGIQTTTSTTGLASRLGYPSNTTRRTLEDLACYGVIARAHQGDGKADLWSITSWTSELYRKATLPEIRSEPPQPNASDAPHSPTINALKRIPGTVSPSHDRVSPESDDLAGYPTDPCPACGGTLWWQRPGSREWVCCRCHPDPTEGGR